MGKTRSCAQCGETLTGRLDKKFCDDQCRSNFNNLLNSDISSIMRNINYLLRKNRRIMAALLPGNDKIKIDKIKLIETGFDFRYFTHIYKNRKGCTYKVCYDFGFQNLDNDQVLLARCKPSPLIRNSKNKDAEHILIEQA